MNITTITEESGGVVAVWCCAVVRYFRRTVMTPACRESLKRKTSTVVHLIHISVDSSLLQIKRFIYPYVHVCTCYKWQVWCGTIATTTLILDHKIYFTCPDTLVLRNQLKWTIIRHDCNVLYDFRTIWPMHQRNSSKDNSQWKYFLGDHQSEADLRVCNTQFEYFVKLDSKFQWSLAF